MVRYRQISMHGNHNGGSTHSARVSNGATLEMEMRVHLNCSLIFSTWPTSSSLDCITQLKHDPSKLREGHRKRY